jgi:putative tryptophan/tyrosine transport system substrate-binding protein
MRRRNFITILSSAAAAWPLAARGQQPARVPRIGILSDWTPLEAARFFEPFVQGLRDLGYVEGHNIAFERRYAENKEEILPSLATELVRLQPEVILAIGTGAAWAAKNATQTIPIVFARVGDPIGSGLVSSLARPGGNLTGLSLQYVDIEAKRLELLIMAVPDAKRVGALWDPRFPTAGATLKLYEGAARSLNLELVPAEVQSVDDLEPAIRSIAEQRAGALIVVPGSIFAEHLRRMADLTAKARLPVMLYRRDFVEAGCLMSYGIILPDMYRRAAAYVDKILNGAKPADLPVEQPTKFELVINLKTAKALGLTVPQSLLARADEVIE